MALYYMIVKKDYITKKAILRHMYVKKIELKIIF